ncbi:MAG TPA: substrate-binding domain-containing protein, partial [Candidatus Bathyarchaeia archaeon]|nr:substrate-binding domain-containing protein [Candidatus Bathyarchaeia archaeon]
MRTGLFVAGWLALLTLGASAAEAQDVQVWSAGAVRSVVTDLAAAFRAETGRAVELSFGTVGVTRQRLAGNEPVDV